MTTLEMGILCPIIWRKKSSKIILKHTLDFEVFETIHIEIFLKKKLEFL